MRIAALTLMFIALLPVSALATTPAPGKAQAASTSKPQAHCPSVHRNAQGKLVKTYAKNCPQPARSRTSSTRAPAKG
ncbi:MAG: hypothetical protein GAK43_00771 [Stenotrophomonas maltophilia]|nr:MAG: hypothetical protein GAK43_00771 [Stenotrophomonas maltophilia]